LNERHRHSGYCRSVAVQDDLALNFTAHDGCRGAGLKCLRQPLRIRAASTKKPTTKFNLRRYEGIRHLSPFEVVQLTSGDSYLCRGVSHRISINHLGPPTKGQWALNGWTDLPHLASTSCCTGPSIRPDRSSRMARHEAITVSSRPNSSVAQNGLDNMNLQ